MRYLVGAVVVAIIAAAIGWKWYQREQAQHRLEQAQINDLTARVGQLQDGEHMMVLENTPRVHHLVVCTLCSCYPWSVLGLPPVWYKSTAYRARAVNDPRGLLEEFGVDVRDKEVRVWDSSSEMRYFVIPERPAGTDGMSEEELAELVTRDSMIGTGLPKSPTRPARQARAAK